MITPSESRTETTHMVLYEHINHLCTLHGGVLMQWVDVIGAVCASRHSGGLVTTAALDSLDFKKPIKLGEMVTLTAVVTWVGRTSMEIRVDVYNEKPGQLQRCKTNTAFLVFVALDENRNPREVPALTPETDAEKQEYQDALKRREIRMSRTK